MINSSLSKSVDIADGTIRQILIDSGICEEIVSISTPIAWVLQSYKILLTGGRTLFLQFCHQDFADDAFVESRVHAIRMLQELEFTQPKVISYSANPDAYGLSYILSEAHTGSQVFQLYPNASPVARRGLYKAIAQAYSKIHKVTNDWAGVWGGSSDKKKYPIHPAQFYYGAEIQNGCNRQLLDHEKITADTYRRICKVWESKLEFLMNRDTTLVHTNSFPWNIRVRNDDGPYKVCGFSGIEFMWWDPMYDIANLLYPPFMDITDEERTVFIEHYAHPINREALNLYRLLNRVLGFANCFMAPVDDQRGDQWVTGHVHELNQLLDEIG